MLEKLPKRRRMVIATALFGGVAIALILILLYVRKPEDATYLPGQNTEGLTTELNRNIPDDYPRVTFKDVSGNAGINFRHFQGTRNFQLPEDMGSGAAWGDYDQDGWIDLYVVNFAGPITSDNQVPPDAPATCTLYHNNGDGTFTDVSKQAGVALRCWGMAASWGDYDNDGRPDLFVSAFGRNHLFHNNGNGTFTDVSDQTGIAAFEGFWAGATWGDFNRDGYLDLYVCGYVQFTYQNSAKKSLQYDVEVPASINPSSFPPERNLLFKNNGNGTFTEMAGAAGVADEKGRSLSATWADLDADGWPDIYVANDVSDNVLYKNLGNGTFKEISHNALVADYRGAMGIAVGDWDGDADYDMFITHWIAQENALYSSLFTQLTSADNPLQELRFMDLADRYGLGQIALDYIGWGTSFFDYNNDGRPDLFVANGSTFQEKDDPRLLIPMQNLLFWNRDNLDGFYEVSTVSGAVFGEKHVGRGVAFGDYDNDGDVDLFVVNNNGAAQLLRNDGGNQNNWLELRLEGTGSNRSGIGTGIRVVAGGITQIQQAGAQGPYCSQNSPALHLGLGSASQVDTLDVTWPSGKKQRFTGLPANRILRITEGKKEANPL
ncbi:MAG: CRTAC1 family protein [Bacteroidetes bacterium]|nr:MAG: CRTAC1 family protein [Bacteroidota bacterium]